MKVLTSAATLLDGTPAGRAIVSADEKYRYSLTRHLGGDGPHWLFLMLNPSKARHDIGDPTVGRVTGYAQAWGLRGFTIANLFALSATNPAELRRHPDPVGPANDKFLRRLCKPGVQVIAAWGASGGRLAAARAAVVLPMVARPGVQMSCLALTGRGEPRHPLFMPAAIRADQLIPYPARTS